MKLDAQIQEKIDGTFIEIDGACDAAWLLAEAARSEAESFQKSGFITEPAAGKLKEYIDSISYLLTSIQASVERFFDRMDENTPEDIKRAIGTPALLKAARLTKGYTEEKLSELSGVASDAIRAYESGERVPRDEIKVKLAEALERPVEELFF